MVWWAGHCHHRLQQDLIGAIHVVFYHATFTCAVLSHHHSLAHSMELSIDIYHPSQVLPCFPRAPSTVKLLPKGLALSDRTNLIRVGPSHRPTNYHMYLLYLLSK